MEKKHPSLASSEEKVLRYLTFIEQWIDIFSIFILNSTVIAAAFNYGRNHSFDNIINFARGITFDNQGKKLEGTKISFLSKVAAWLFVFWLLIKSLLYFAIRYINCKVVANYDEGKRTTGTGGR